MDDERLFDLEGIPEIPIFREPRRASAARGAHLDGRFRNDYPPEWDKCEPCDACLWMGSIKARVRLEAGHRCVRCLHPYIPKGDARMLGREPTPFRWSPCDARCVHKGPLAVGADGSGVIAEDSALPVRCANEYVRLGGTIYAEWRILTVHHLDGDKSNCRWWNLAALCQRCHLEIQAKVVLERIYPHEHSEWFKPYVAGWYAWAYLNEELSREQAMDRIDELLALERTPA
jgi:hypothetical protein